MLTGMKKNKIDAKKATSKSDKAKETKADKAKEATPKRKSSEATSCSFRSSSLAGTATL